MKTVGNMLREAREATGVTIDEIAKRTRIRVDFLEAIEEERFEDLPKGPFVKGFIRTFAREVGLNPDHTAAVYRRDHGEESSSMLVPKGAIKPIRKRVWFLLTPHTAGIAFVALVIGAFLFFQIRSFNQPPPLIVLEPTESQEVRSPVVVRGKTATDCVVSVNSGSIAVDQDGNFRIDVPLTVGEQTITVNSTNRKGKTRVVQRTVHVVE